MVACLGVAQTILWLIGDKGQGLKDWLDWLAIGPGATADAT